MSTLARTLAAAALLTSGLALAGEYAFDAGEFEKKTFEFSGYLEQKEEGLTLRSGRPAYALAYPGVAGRSALLRSSSTVDLTGKLNLDPLVADLRVQAGYASDPLLSAVSNPKIMEGGVRWSAGPGLSLDLGKRVQRWGKGYAWTTVGFVERPKDSSDPTAAREGFEMASAEWTKSLSGPISTISLTGLVVPSNDSMNADFGQVRHLNPAAKLYLLAFDTDIDFMWRGKGAKAQSYGFDFSRNLSTALEVHGEWARTLDAPRNTVTADGVSSSGTSDYSSWLLGVRYLTPGEVTWIGEYYRNGSGYSAGELADYYSFLDRALAPNAPATLASKARSVAQSGYGRPNPGRDYLYVKASVSEPFGWLYGSASLAAMSNLNDGSWQLTPEVAYTGFNQVELRARVIVTGGQVHSEFGEKLASRRLELTARLFF